MKLQWRWPHTSRKAHLFPSDDAISLCGKWLFTGRSQGEFDPSAKRGSDDCAACDKIARMQHA